MAASDDDKDRLDENLIKVVEILGDRASTKSSKLVIENFYFDENEPWYIYEYDGIEHVESGWDR